MLKSPLIAAFVVSVSLSSIQGQSIIPAPVSVTEAAGDLSLSGKVGFKCPKDFEDTFLLGMKRLTANSSVRLDSSAHPLVYVSKDATIRNREAYQLVVAPEGITIKAGGKAGVYYATQTLLQLMPAEVFRPEAKLKSVTLNAVKISDKPRFPWRGLMLDSSRHFQTIPEIKRFIDNMAIHKLNVFHWHITDGHGWRFESKKYPKLTEVGAWRMQPGYPTKGKKEKYGGFYTQKEMREVVAYAAARNVTIVPEVDMPGHCFSFVAAYPEAGCLGKPQGTDFFYTYPADAQRFPSKFGTDVLCVSKKQTLKMCLDILDEVMEIFPSKFIHIGGDEVNKSYWKNCSSCQAHIKKNKLHGEHGLQSWFIQQLDNHISSKGRRLIGWDEILEGGLAKNATVMSWRGEQGGIKASKMGHDVVMSPQTYIYLDHGQSHSPLEPPHWPGHKPLDRAYSYEPIPKGFTPKQAKHILGVQGNVWTVFTHEEWLIDICTWPRACAIAETGWTPKAKKNWDDFHQRLSNTHRKRLDALGINYWWEQAHDLGTWTPKMLKPDEKHVTLSYDISKQLKGFKGGDFPVTFTYTGGP
ncbi:MAG: beta-N-acetylhexosaminidase, partial [Akkermansiaceae bacterium]